ncbi:ribonuclease H-like domain-containing protein [Phascolomyces articulosus]|uniref:Ribonuclease H-like domain-containing protein n=1 Tax=Phascolomyces articulosus TaxID=60185 RepID=A0AAD5KGN6_9FUNG|nr:ribonuclease H-like domain-containing protein [Phascolomyces articulosus]
MEIPRQQFHSKLQVIKEAIDECDFIAIDTELSGLHRPGGSKRLDTLENRYIEYKEATERFMIIQFGMCTFTWDEPGGRYIAKPFNFYIFPTSMTGKIQPNRIFMTQAQAFDFLAKQSFDFNKWVYQGIPYLTVTEEKEYISEAVKKVNDHLPDIRIDEKERKFVEDAKSRIRKWKEDPKKTDDTDGVNINTRNAYQRRLIYQEVRKSFPDLTAEGRAGFIRIMKFTEEQRKKRVREQHNRIKKDCEDAVGFRKVIDMISASRKVVVGHNMLLDICHVIAQFIQPLPETVHEFKKLSHQVFPLMIDTKYLCAASTELRAVIGSGTALENLRFETNQEKFKNPYVDMSIEFPRYLHDKEHEAGYDAYVTGLVLLKLHSHLEIQANPPPPETPEEEKQEEEVESEKDEVPEEKRKLRGNTGGWNISDDEEGEDANWLASDDEDDQINQDDDEDIYNYGSTRYPLTDHETRKPTSVIAGFVNKVVMVRTAFEYFDFANPERIDPTLETFYINSASSNDIALLEKEILALVSEYGKCIIDTVSNGNYDGRCKHSQTKNDREAINPTKRDQEYSN